MTQYCIPTTTSPHRTRILDNLCTFLRGLDGKKVWEVEVEPYQKPRTNQQCRYLNGVAYKLLSEATGYERDDISEYLCGRFFGWKEKLKPGKVKVQVPLRTTTTDENGKRDVLSKQAFADYVEFVQRFGAQHGVMIPNPDQEFEDV